MASPGEGRTDPAPRFFYGWVVVGVAFSTEFVAGCVIYPFAVFLTQFADEFGGGDRTPILSVQLLASVVGIALAPLLGRLAGRGLIRALLVGGMILLGSGLIAMAHVQSLWQLALVFGLLLTGGASCLSGVPPTTLVVNWFERRRATALGAAQIGASLAGVALPPLVAWLAASRDWRGAYEIVGIAVLCLTPLVWRLTVARPEQRGQRSDGDPAEPEASAAATDESLAAAPPFRTADALREPNLLLISLATGLAFTSVAALLTHIAAFGTDLGFGDARAAWLLSTLSVGAVLGKLLFGWLTDRIGPRAAFLISLVGHALGLVALIGVSGYAITIGVLLMMGLATGGTYPISSALLAQAVGRDKFGPMFGLMWLIATPVSFVGPILAAWIHDLRGSYDAAFGLFVFVLLAAALLVRAVHLSSVRSGPV
jgi:MFS family permease